MSGHFVLNNITAQEIQDIQNAWLASHLPVPVLGALQHAVVGWNAASRTELTHALNGPPIANRNGLPPHKYLDFAVNNIGNIAIAYLIQNRADNGWVSRLLRPGNNMGLTALTVDAQAEWVLGRNREALIAQIRGNGATLEIYHLDGVEIV